MSKDQAAIELRIVLDDLGVWDDFPARKKLREPEMGDNVFRRLQTQRDPLRMSAQVESPRFDSVRRRQTL
jgi:hypothetical protein